MYSQQHTRVRDAQNPYRTGVLIGNYTEDKFGLTLAQQPVSDAQLTPHRKTAVLESLRIKQSSRLTQQF